MTNTAFMPFNSVSQGGAGTALTNLNKLLDLEPVSPFCSISTASSQLVTATFNDWSQLPSWAKLRCIDVSFQATFGLRSGDTNTLITQDLALTIGGNSYSIGQSAISTAIAYSGNNRWVINLTTGALNYLDPDDVVFNFRVVRNAAQTVNVYRLALRAHYAIHPDVLDGARYNIAIYNPDGSEAGDLATIVRKLDGFQVAYNYTGNRSIPEFSTWTGHLLGSTVLGKADGNTQLAENAVWGNTVVGTSQPWLMNNLTFHDDTKVLDIMPTNIVTNLVQPTAQNRYNGTYFVVTRFL